jgi:hypothetical protein
MLSKATAEAGGAQPYRGVRQAPSGLPARLAPDRAPAFALLVVVAWSLLRLLVPDGSGFDLEHVLAAMFALASAALLLKESLR